MADLLTLCSNQSSIPFTPDELLRLAALGDRKYGKVDASYRPHELSKRLGKAKVQELADRARAGESATSLAGECGIATSALLRLLRERGVTVEKRKVTADHEVALAREYEKGATVAELEKRFGLSHGTVLGALHRAGVEMRAKAPRPLHR